MRKCSNSPSSRPRATPDRIRSSPRRKWSQSRPRNSESIFSSPIVARPRRTIWKVKKASVWVWGSFRKLARNLFGVLRRKAWNMHGNISTSAKIYRPGVAPANFTSCAATCLFHFFCIDAKLDQNEWTLTWNWGFWMRSAPRRYRWFSLASWGCLVRSADSLLLLTGLNRLGNWNHKVVPFIFQFLYVRIVCIILLQPMFLLSILFFKIYFFTCWNIKKWLELLEKKMVENKSNLKIKCSSREI